MVHKLSFVGTVPTVDPRKVKDKSEYDFKRVLFCRCGGKTYFDGDVFFEYGKSPNVDYSTVPTEVAEKKLGRFECICASCGVLNASDTFTEKEYKYYSLYKGNIVAESFTYFEDEQFDTVKVVRLRTTARLDPSRHRVYFVGEKTSLQFNYKKKLAYLRLPNRKMCCIGVNRMYDWPSNFLIPTTGTAEVCVAERDLTATRAAALSCMEKFTAAVRKHVNEKDITLLADKFTSEIIPNPADPTAYAQVMLSANLLLAVYPPVFSVFLELGYYNTQSMLYYNGLTISNLRKFQPRSLHDFVQLSFRTYLFKAKPQTWKKMGKKFYRSVEVSIPKAIYRGVDVRYYTNIFRFIEACGFDYFQSLSVKYDMGDLMDIASLMGYAPQGNQIGFYKFMLRMVDAERNLHPLRSRLFGNQTLNGFMLSVGHTVSDTLRMARLLEMDQKVVSRCRNYDELSTLHDRLSTRMNEVKLDGFRKAFASRLESEGPFYAASFLGYEFEIVPTPERLIKEGEEMAHCVGGGYSAAHADRSHTIIFVCNTVTGERGTIDILTPRRMNQLKGKRNGQTSTEMQLAVMKYLSDRSISYHMTCDIDPYFAGIPFFPEPYASAVTRGPDWKPLPAVFNEEIFTPADQENELAFDIF